MRRILKTLGLVVLLLVLGVAWLLATTFLGRRAVLDGAEIGETYIISDGFSTVGMFPMGPGQVGLVDAGQDASGEAILAELARRRLGPDAVAAILLTHGHPDHTGAIGQFPRAEVMALAADVPLVEGRAAARGPLPRFFPVSPTGVKVTRVLRDGDILRLGTMRIRVYAVPGHTGGSAAYVIDDVLFIGDSADVETDGTLRGSPWIFSDSQEENVASLARLASRLAADRVTITDIVPSHSGPVQGIEPLTEFVRAQEENR